MPTENNNNDTETSTQAATLPSLAKNKWLSMWRLLTLAVIIAVSVVMLACYLNLRDEQEAAEQARIQLAVLPASGAIPDSEEAAEAQAQWLSSEQSQGMTAPADIGEDAASALTASETQWFNDDLPETGARVTEHNGIVLFEFTENQSEVAKNASSALQNVLSGVKSGKKVLILSDSGNNIHLAQSRASKVRDTLLTLGVPENSIQIGEIRQHVGLSNQVEVLLQ